MGENNPSRSHTGAEEFETLFYDFAGIDVEYIYPRGKNQWLKKDFFSKHVHVLTS
jgi:hypothetical protein